MSGATSRVVATSISAIRRSTASLNVFAFQRPVLSLLVGVVLRLPHHAGVVARDGVEVVLALDDVAGVDAAVGRRARRELESVRPVPPTRSSWPSLPLIVSEPALPKAKSSLPPPSIVVAAALAVEPVVAVLAADRVAVRGAGGRIACVGRVDVPDLDRAG